MILFHIHGWCQTETRHEGTAHQRQGRSVNPDSPDGQDCCNSCFSAQEQKGIQSQLSWLLPVITAFVVIKDMSLYVLFQGRHKTSVHYV